MEKMARKKFVLDEIYITYTILNEVCNIVDIPDFEIRLAFDEDTTFGLKQKIGDLYEKHANNPKEISIELSMNEVYLICNAFNEICNGVDIPDFEVRIGFSRDIVQSLHNKFIMILDEFPS